MTPLCRFRHNGSYVTLQQLQQLPHQVKSGMPAPVRPGRASVPVQGAGDAQHVRPLRLDPLVADLVAGDGVSGPQSAVETPGHGESPQPLIGQIGQPRRELVTQ